MHREASTWLRRSYYVPPFASHHHQMDFHVILDADGMGTPAHTRSRKTFGMASQSSSKRRNARTIKYFPDLPHQSRQSNIGSSSTRRARVPTSNRLGNLASSAHSGIVSVYPTGSRPHTYVAAQGSVKQHPPSGWKSDIKHRDRNVSSSIPSHSVCSATSSSRCRTSMAVSKVREDMVRESARRGRLGTRTIMDFVLDSKSPSVDYSEEFFREMAIRCRVLSPFRHEYAFVIGYEHALQDYWDEQSRIWAGVDDIQSLVGFPDSYERGNASRMVDTTTRTQQRQERTDHRELSEMLIRRLSALARDLNL